MLSETTTSVQRGHVSGWKSEVNMAGDVDLMILTVMAVHNSIQGGYSLEVVAS